MLASQLGHHGVGVSLDGGHVVVVLGVLGRRWGIAIPVTDRLGEEPLTAGAHAQRLVGVVEHDGGTQGGEVIIADGRDEPAAVPSLDGVAVQLVQVGDLVHPGKA
jgi:hypothetical protein